MILPARALGASVGCRHEQRKRGDTFCTSDRIDNLDRDTHSNRGNESIETHEAENQRDAHDRDTTHAPSPALPLLRQDPPHI